MADTKQTTFIITFHFALCRCHLTKTTVGPVMSCAHVCVAKLPRRPHQSSTPQLKLARDRKVYSH